MQNYKIKTKNAIYKRLFYPLFFALVVNCFKFVIFDRLNTTGDRYYLQYRTAGDKRVRPEHAALNRVTLPISDSFWETFFPPNGWNCRCTVVQVRKSKYEATDHDEAMSRGDAATGKDTRGLFRFNPGMQQKAMPDYNPYTIQKCRDCDIAKGKFNLAKPFIPDNEVCAACEILHKCIADKAKSQRAIERTHYLHEMERLFDKRIIKETKNGNIIKVRFNKSGNRHLYSDVLSRTKNVELEDLISIDTLLENATYYDEAIKVEGHNNPYEYFYYFIAKINGAKIRINVGKEVTVRKNGKISVKYICYSINDIK